MHLIQVKYEFRREKPWRELDPDQHFNVLDAPISFACPRRIRSTDGICRDRDVDFVLMLTSSTNWDDRKKSMKENPANPAAAHPFDRRERVALAAAKGN